MNTGIAILLVFLKFGYAGGVITQEYATMSACLQAAKIVRDDAEHRGTSVLALSCTNKQEK